jgi:drug/metabolite transporter (DMT)-like permease
MSTQPSSSTVPAAVAAGVTVVLWASAFVGIRAVGTALSPGGLAFSRLMVGSAALGMLVAVRREGLPPRRALPGIVGCGVLWFAAYNVLLNAGERRVDAGTAAMLVNIGPLFIAGLAGVFLKEGFPRTLVAGALTAFTGTAILAAATGMGDGASLPGVALCVAAAMAYAAGVVIQKPLLTHASALQVTWLACVVGAVVCLPFAPSALADLRGADASVLWWVAFLGIFPTAVAFTTWAYALRRTTAGRMGATTYLVPPLAVLLGWLVLAEVPPLLALAGGTLCLVGVALARRGPVAPVADAPAEPAVAVIRGA